jgi:membrane-bound lytic murein transglycosylase F
MRRRVSILVAAAAVILSCCVHKQDERTAYYKEKNFEKGKILAVTNFNSINYFIYRGVPMGFQYELLRDLSLSLGLKFEVVATDKIEKSFDMLEGGKCDLIALNLFTTPERQKIMDFTHPLFNAREVLIQRKASKNNIRNDKFIHNYTALGGKVIYIQKKSAYLLDLKRIAREIKDSINVIEIPEQDEQLARLVSEGEIDYTVCDENIAREMSRYYPNLDISTVVRSSQEMGWAVKKENKALLDKINTWIDEYKKSGRFTKLYNRYYTDQRTENVTHSANRGPKRGHISIYDRTIKFESNKIGWDWRLLASLIYQESRFQCDVVSWSGAKGLMQLMPVTAKKFGIRSHSSPEDNIKAGVQFIHFLDKQFKDKVKDKDERIKFILASYNIGMGHILDARRLAIKNGKDPSKWENHVAYYLSNKNDPRYYTDPVVKFGYCRGQGACSFVTEVLQRYHRYKKFIKE